METVVSFNYVFAVKVLAFFTVLILALTATVLAIRNTRGPREKSFILYCSIAAWLVLSGTTTLALTMPPPWPYIVIGLYFLHLPVAVYTTTQKQQQIREKERRL